TVEFVECPAGTLACDGGGMEQRKAPLPPPPPDLSHLPPLVRLALWLGLLRPVPVRTPDRPPPPSGRRGREHAGMPPEVSRHALTLTGPTGSGKSQLAPDLAEQLGTEIVGLDSMTLYRGLDVGTAKPSAADRRRVPHHLLDVLDPWESASVAWWLDRAADCVRDIQARGRRALFVGGTPLYLKALLHGLFDGPPAAAALRQRLEQEAERDGWPALHARLARVDPAGAARLHPNDLRRVVRALEVHELTGRPISAWQTQWRSTP